jgi:hypothetical protein
VKKHLLTLAAAACLAVGSASGAETTNRPSFGGLETMAVAKARTQAEAWLKDAGKSDAATQQAVEAIWKSEITVLEKVTRTLSLDPAVAQMLTEASNPAAPAPTAVPDVIKNQKNAFVKANLALAYGRVLSNRRVHEEAVEALKMTTPEQVVDPAAYLFHKAVSEHALLRKDEARKAIIRLIEDVTGAPERYRTVSALMLVDMQLWKEKDLSAVARKMENVERRLELARGGPQTQKLQKEVVARLDELIKEMENKNKPKPPGPPGDPKDGKDPNDGSCPASGPPGPGQPGSGPPNGTNPSAPAADSAAAGGAGTGNVDQAKLKKLVENWGSLPPREQNRALQELTQGLPARHREAIENYFRNLANAQSRK